MAKFLGKPAKMTSQKAPQSQIRFGVMIIFTLFLVSLASASFCYQEIANISTICGGLNTGSYSSSGSWYDYSYDYTILKLYDGNWNTFTEANNGFDGYMYVNYTKPSLATSTSLWKIKDASGISNFTLPSSCWNAYPDKLSLMIHSSQGGGVPFTETYCWDGSSWRKQTIDSGAGFYEEGIYWNMSSIPTIINITSPKGFQGVKTIPYILNLSYTSIDYHALDSCWANWNGTNVTLSQPKNYSYQASADEISLNANWNNPNNIHDSNFGTSGTANADDALFYMNYTKPVNATSDSLWRVKDSIEDIQIGISNSCWNANATKLILRVKVIDSSSDTYWDCYNGTDWETLRFNDYGDRVYEQAMNWSLRVPRCNDNFTLNISNSSAQNIIYIYANDTLGNLGYASSYWSSLIYNNETYNNATAETHNETFILNMEYPSSDYIISGRLIYNGVSYLSSKVTTGNNVVFTSDQVYIPIVPSIINMTFYWNVTMNNGTDTYYIMPSHNQTINLINRINVTNLACSSGYFEAANYTFYDEYNRTSLNASVKYNFQYGESNYTQIKTYGEIANTNVLRICINETQNNLHLGYGEIQYQDIDGDRTSRRYYMFEGYSLSNSTTSSYNLYDLLTLRATSFVFEIKDNFLNPYTNKYLGLLKWYPELNEYRIVEMAKTDDKGTTIMKVKTEDVDYRIAVYELNGDLIKLAEPIRMACLVSPCTYTLRIAPGGIGFFDIYNLQANLSYSDALNRFTFIWNDPSQNTQIMNLKVVKETGFQDITICDINGTGITGIIYCDVGNQTGIITARVYRMASPFTIIASLTKQFANIMDKNMGLFIAIILAMVTALIGVFSPIGAIIMVLVGLIPSVIFGTITLPIAMAIGTLGGIVIHIIKKT
jgi:hypothetical protein